MAGSEPYFVEWKEQYVSKERGNRVVHYFFKDNSGDSIPAVVGTERSVRHMFYVVSEEFISAHGANSGYAMFLVALVAVPLINFWYVKGRVGVYGGYILTVAVIGLCGLADGLVQGGVVGNAGELPERYMQAVFA